MIKNVKTKIFRFEVANAASRPFEKDKKELWYQNNIKKIKTEQQIETEINVFLKDKTFVDMKVSTVDIQYHNNGRANTIHLIYTILYTE